MAEEWRALERHRGEVERAFVALLEAGDYTSGLSARYESARAEYERVRARIAQTQSTHFLGTLSAQASDETNEILEDLRALADADHAIMAAGDFFALRPGWRAIWDNEVGPVFEDLQAVDNVGVKVRDHVKNPKVHGATKSLFQWTNEQRALLLGLGTRLERAEVTPAQALEELDRIANESRTRLADVVTSALALDTSMEGRQRYARWQSPPAELVNAAEMFYKGSYLSQGATHEYNPASTIRMTANSAGVNLAAYRANTSSRFKDYDSYIYVRPLYLDEYVISSGSTTSSTSSANYGSSSGGFSGSGSSSSF